MSHLITKFYFLLKNMLSFFKNLPPELMLIYCPLVTRLNLPIKLKLHNSRATRDVCVCVLSPKTAGLFYLLIHFLDRNLVLLSHPCWAMTHHLCFLQKSWEMREEFLILQRKKIKIT